MQSIRRHSAVIALFCQCPWLTAGRAITQGTRVRPSARCCELAQRTPENPRRDCLPRVTTPCGSASGAKTQRREWLALGILYGVGLLMLFGD
jgi:hypothetical protein